MVECARLEGGYTCKRIEGSNPSLSASLQKIMNHIAYFEVQASDPPKLANFYKEVFGWNFSKDKSIPIEYYRIEMAGIYGGLLKRPAKTPPMEYGTNAFTCSIQVENFNKTAAKILEHGGQVALPKFAIPGKCWQGYFIDSDNNVFGIFQVDSQAK